MYLFGFFLIGECAAGYSGNPCVECRKGTYKTDPGAASCTDCPEGLTTDGTGKTMPGDCSKILLILTIFLNNMITFQHI